MAHGGYNKRRVKQAGRRSKSLGAEKKKPKAVSLKNQIRSVERILRKDLPDEVRIAQAGKLEGLKKQQEIHTRLAVERKMFLRDRKIKFFERRKIERRIRRLEKLQRASSAQPQDAETAEQLSNLREDLEYVRFFPKTEKYIALFTGGEDPDVVVIRNRLREQIKANLVAAAASGKDLEETGSEDDGLLDMSDDDFFEGSSDEEVDADDEWTDKSTREQASSASGKATSGMSSDERNQRQISARALMPPPRPSNKSYSNTVRGKSKFAPSSSRNYTNPRAITSTSSATSNSSGGPSYKTRVSSNSGTTHGSNLSSNSDAHKPRRKRRPKKKKQQV